MTHHFERTKICTKDLQTIIVSINKHIRHIYKKGDIHHRPIKQHELHIVDFGTR
jgi:hypothetical protein